MKKISLCFLSVLFSIIYMTTIFGDVVVFEPTTSPGVIYEYYLDRSGKTVKTRSVTNVYNDKYYMVAPEIDGYVCVNARVNDNSLLYADNTKFNSGVEVTLNSFSTKGDYVIFLYAEDEYNRGYPDENISRQDIEIIQYDNSSGRKIDTIEDTGRIGETYRFSPKTSVSYNNRTYRLIRTEPEKDDDDYIEFFITDDVSKNSVYTYYQEGSDDTRYIKVHYIDVETDKEFYTDTVSNVKVNETYVYEVKQKGGYNFLSSSPASGGLKNDISFKVYDDTSKNNIYCYFKSYISDDINHYDQYDGNNQYYVSPTDTFFDNAYGYNKINRSSGISLNTTPYYSFVIGYSDNTFRPNNNITRAEASQMFYNIALDKHNGNIGYIFKDLTVNDWYYKPISYLASKGMLSGYSDDTVRPNKYITRAEFIKMATCIAGFEDSGTTLTFSDVNSSSWYYDYVRAGVSLSLLSGYSDNTFRPNNYITRAEATKIVDGMIGRTLEYEYLYRDLYYKDVPTTNWAYPYVKMANGQAKN